MVVVNQLMVVLAVKLKRKYDPALNLVIDLGLLLCDPYANRLKLDEFIRCAAVD